jgi:hypothetical protein
MAIALDRPRHWRLAVFVLTFFVSLFDLSAPATSQDDRACFYVDGVGAKSDLEDGQKDVLSRFGKFDYERKQYRFEALSLWGDGGPTSDKTCFRYEIKNHSGQKLEAVSWADIGMEFVDIAAADRSRWINPSIPARPPVQDMSEIKAFTRSSDLVRAYLPAVAKHAATLPPSPMQGVGFAEFDLRDSMPEAVKALDAANLPIRRITIMGQDALPNGRSSLTSQFSNRTLAFQHTSDAFREGQTITVSERIMFYYLTSETEVSAPYIFALDSLKKPIDAEAVSQFASMIKEVKNQWRKFDKWDKIVTAPIGTGTPALFVVSHPVTVRTKDEIFCLSVRSFSVLPVEAAANYCGSRQ